MAASLFMFHQVIVVIDFGFNKSFFKISVNDSGCLRGFGAFF
jgi:hypothetical protein